MNIEILKKNPFKKLKLIRVRKKSEKNKTYSNNATFTISR